LEQLAQVEQLGQLVQSVTTAAISALERVDPVILQPMAPNNTVRWFPRKARPGGRPFEAEFDPELKTRLLVLQPTPFCNIDCDYCYLPDRDSKARMSLHTVRRTIERLNTDRLLGKSLDVVWHAGEPLVMPRDFYDEAIATIQDAVGVHCAVSHSVQTNATLIDDAWCALFRRHCVRVGVSIDGPAELHDKYRRTRNGSGTHAKVLHGMQCLREHGVPFHAIAVVTDAALDHPDAFYDFFVQQRVQELGCNFDEAEGAHGRSSLEGKEEAHAAFLDRLLERSASDGGRLRIRELANAARLIADRPPVYRWHGRTWPDNAQVVPFALITVAWNGDFCTFSPELLGQPSREFGDFVLGNVEREGFVAAARSERFTRLWNAITLGTQSCQQTCAHFDYCGGGAPANKLFENGDLTSAETLYCRTMFKRPLEAVLQRLERDQRGPHSFLQQGSGYEALSRM
jgi:uncharacterized protein